MIRKAKLMLLALAQGWPGLVMLLFFVGIAYLLGGSR
jgi:hypothetical protein